MKKRGSLVDRSNASESAVPETSNGFEEESSGNPLTQKDLFNKLLAAAESVIENREEALGIVIDFEQALEDEAYASLRFVRTTASPREILFERTKNFTDRHLKGCSQTEAASAVKAMQWTTAKIFSEISGDTKHLEKLRMANENAKSSTGIEAETVEVQEPAPKKAKLEDAKSQQRENSTFSSKDKVLSSENREMADRRFKSWKSSAPNNQQVSPESGRKCMEVVSEFLLPLQQTIPVLTKMVESLSAQAQAQGSTEGTSETDVETHKKLLQALNCMENDIDVFTKIFGILWEQKYVNWQVASALINKLATGNFAGKSLPQSELDKLFKQMEKNRGVPAARSTYQPQQYRHNPQWDGGSSSQRTFPQKNDFFPHKRQQQGAPSRY